MTTNQRGFTIIEILVAITILSVGLLSLAAGSGAVYRMLGQGKRATRAGAMALGRMEILRRTANSTNPRCTSLASGTASYAGSVSESWTVSGSGNLRSVTVRVTYPTNRGTTADSLSTIIGCY
jgi:prepilin-type N-terminal cleavage/methylation domain-containing protein